MTMVPTPRSLLLLLAADIAFVAAALAAQAQTTAGARDDGKAFATAIAKQAQAAARRTPDAASVPNFGRTPSQSALFDNPDAIAGAAASAATSHEGYQSVRSSLDRRPRIPISDIQAAIARGQAVAKDPMSYVSGMGIGGGQGRCRELPPSTASRGYYEATCNQGVALEQKQERCTMPLFVTFEERSAYRYYAEQGGHTGLAPSMADFQAAIDTGICQVEGPTDPCQVVRHYGLQPSRRCGNYVTNIVRCSTELGRLGGNYVPVTGQHWFQRVIERVPVASRQDGACASLAGDPACSFETETCTSSDPVTRVVDGVTVTQPCWAWDRTYQCNRPVPAQDCTELDTNPACNFVREECLTDEDPCKTVERVYRCPMPEGPSGQKQYICDGDIYCIGGECETIDRQANDEFKDAAVALNAAAQAGREFDPDNLSLFKGARETCRRKVFGLLNCCAGKAFPLIPGASLLVSMGCNREEMLLHERDNAGLCAYVGSFCSDSVLGICTTKKKVYCCFESKLSRILQEQGRAQLGKPWDKPKTETCQGFTVDEFARLDLSRMDFSEVYAEFQDAAKLPEELSTVSAMQQKIADFYTASGARP
jgi:conjugal transfer mating pair stabilization protein TraN